MRLKATKTGTLKDKQLGIPIVIKDSSQTSAVNVSYKNEGIVHEIKRVGFLIDRFVDLHLRIGDLLIVYL